MRVCLEEAAGVRGLVWERNAIEFKAGWLLQSCFWKKVGWNRVKPIFEQLINHFVSLHDEAAQVERFWISWPISVKRFIFKLLKNRNSFPATAKTETIEHLFPLINTSRVRALRPVWGYQELANSDTMHSGKSHHRNAALIEWGSEKPLS